jgi:CO dehydrogenase maturation factor
MRIALAGKGGAGKTTIAATLARVEARRGGRVLAVDGDSNPNLAAALGIQAGLVGAPGSLSASLVSRRLHGPALTIPVDELMDRHAVLGPDGVRLLLMGMPAHADEGCLCAAHATVSALLGDLADRPDILTVVDMEASPEHLSRGTTRHADVLLLVAEPYYRSLETIRRLAGLAAELSIPRVAVVANKVRSAAEAQAVAEFCTRHQFERLAEVAWSDEVVEADRAGVPLLDATPGGVTVTAISRLAAQLRPATS